MICYSAASLNQPEKVCMRLVQQRGCLSLGSFPGNEASFSYYSNFSRLWIFICGLKSVAAKAATAATVPTPLPLQLACLRQVSTNDILRILVKAQPRTRSTGPRPPTRLGIRSQDLGLPSEYSLGHCGLSAASRHKLAFTSRHYTLLTATDTTALTKTPLFFLINFFKVDLSLSSKFRPPHEVPPGHILTNLIINWLLDVNADRKWGKSPILRTVNGWRFPKRTVHYYVYKDKEFYQLGFQVCWPWKRRVPCHLKHHLYVKSLYFQCKIVFEAR